MTLWLTFSVLYSAKLYENHNEEQYKAEQCALKSSHITCLEQLANLRFTTFPFVLSFLTCLYASQFTFRLELIL